MTFVEARFVQWWVRLLGAIVLLLVVFLVYARVGAAGFIWDDESHLTQNPCIIGPLGLADIWTSASAVYYPLVLTTFWILHHFVGLNPLPYHILNVAFHAASALLLWRVLVQLRMRGAWLGAAIWALHPVLVQSVAWITEMKNTQSALFYLLAISCFLESRDRKRNGIFYWLTIFFFVAAITSKPSTVMLPVVLALCLWWREGGIKQRDLRLLLPFVLVSLLGSGWTIWEQKFHSHAAGAEWVQTPLQRILVSADAIWFYLLKLIWPHPLIFIYPRWEVEPSRWFAWIPLAALLVVAAVLFIKRNTALRPVAFAFAYFVITLFPVLDFSLQLRQRSFPVSRQHGAAGPDGRRRCHGGGENWDPPVSDPSSFDPGYLIGAWRTDLSSKRKVSRSHLPLSGHPGTKSKMLDGRI